MTGEDVKRYCAREALTHINNNTIIAISYLIEYIQAANMQVQIVTPSFQTKMLCINKGLEVLHTCFVDRIDVAFDGCDEVDENLNALKSGGGIHTKEKLIANMAEDYILLVDTTKFVKALTFKHPVVLEILEDSLKYVERAATELGGQPVARSSAAKDGLTISDNGNILIDVHFHDVKDVYELEHNLKNICGVMDTSLFTNVVTKVLIASTDGVKVISNNMGRGEKR
jgi:ribose 5-phosphate isomerase A